VRSQEFNCAAAERNGSASGVSRRVAHSRLLRLAVIAGTSPGVLLFTM